MTEEEALKKICPLTLDCYPPECCIGAKCMAWKWKSFRSKGAALKEVISKDCPESEENCVWVLSEDKTTWGLFSKRGFCGLAGEP